MEERCIRYIKPANVYRYCCSWGSWPIPKERAKEYISQWILDDNYEIVILENEFVKVFAPQEKS